MQKLNSSMAMHFPSLILLLAMITFLPISSSSTKHSTLYQGSSLSSPGDVLVSSPTGIFTAGFYPVGDNAYCFAIWFTHVLVDGNFTVVWMVNRDQPVNGRNTKLSLLHSGNLVLEDAGLLIVWTSGTKYASTVQLKLHDNGNLVLRSKDHVTIWQSFDHPTNTLLPQQRFTRTFCGANSLCTYNPQLGRRCACVPGYKIKNYRDWSEGCVPEFKKIPSNNDSDTSNFLKLSHTEFYGYDIGYFPNYTLKSCERLCLNYSDCKGFQYKYDWDKGIYSCFPKTLLFNGYQSAGFQDWAYIRLPKYMFKPNKIRSIHKFDLQCTGELVDINRAYKKKHEYAWLKSLAWCVGALGAIEVICLLIFLYKTRGSSSKHEQGYFQVATGFKRFTYAELKKASRNFSEEIGRGGSGVVYKGVLADNRVAAIKYLNEAKQGEAEFLAEIATIGSLNHANLIERWGYCAEGKHRLLVYDYLENGSLAENLDSNKLDWRKRFDIALGTAKGLAYLHEECLEWVLHCDVKPQNILLDSTYQPKVADFGLSKQVNRSSIQDFNVSTIRGTRGYMAPEWVLNLPITSKVDVYSYGIVVLEMVTGKSPRELNLESDNGGVLEHKRLEKWVGKIDEGSSSSWIEQSVDPAMGGEYDVEELKKLVKVALQCVQEKRDARPTMTQVVDMLLGRVTGHVLG